MALLFGHFLADAFDMDPTKTQEPGKWYFKPVDLEHFHSAMHVWTLRHWSFSCSPKVDRVWNQRCTFNFGLYATVFRAFIR